MSNKKKTLLFGIYGGAFGGFPPVFGIDKNYVDYFFKWGNVRMLSTLEDWEDQIEGVDVLVLPGGLDVDPQRYGEKPHAQTSNPNVVHEYLDTTLLKYWLDNKKCIISICRGLQSLNISLGGSLVQHINGHVQKKDGGEPTEVMNTDIPGSKIVQVNTFHHQCIKKLAPELEMIGWTFLSPKDVKQNRNKWDNFMHSWDFNKDTQRLEKSKDLYYAIPELVRGRTLPILGCQFHPEKIANGGCPFFTDLVNEFLKENFKDVESIKEKVQETSK